MTRPEGTKLYFEEVTERIGNVILASSLREPTSAEIQTEVERHAKGKCQHTIIWDSHDWLYDFRYCGICEQCIGLI